MKTSNRRRSWIAGGAGLAIVLASGAMAAGGSPKLAEHSKATNAGRGTSPTLTVGCGKDGRATSAGFKGDLAFAQSPSNIKEALPVRLTLEGDKSQVQIANLNARAKVAAYTYCGGPKLTEASVRKHLNGSHVTPVTAKCESGKVAYSGGFKSTFSVDQMNGPKGSIVVGSYRSSKSAWTTQFVSPVGQAPAVTAYVYCANAKALDAHSKTGSVTLPAGGSSPAVETANVTAKCKRGEVPISGGFRPKRLTLQNGPLTIGSRRSSTTGWTARMAGIASPGTQTSSKVKLTSFVYCAD